MNKHKHSCFGTSAVACFKKWSRKGYAVFSSLGIVVHIANLSLALVQWIVQLFGQEESSVFFRERKDEASFGLIRDEASAMLVPVVVSTHEDVSHKINGKVYINCRQ